MKEGNDQGKEGRNRPREGKAGLELLWNGEGRNKIMEGRKGQEK